MNRIIISDIDFTDSVEGLESVDMEIGATENRAAFSVSSEIVFKGRAYEFLRDTFFENCDGVNRTLRGLFMPGSCPRAISIVIRSDSLVYKPHVCEIQATFTSETPEDLVIQKLEKTTIGDNGFDQAFLHPRVKYSNQPGWIMGFLIFFRSIFFIIIASLSVVINALLLAVNVLLGGIRAIIKIIEFLGGVDLKEPKLIDFIKPSDYYAKIDNLISGAGRYAICPLIREIYTYHLGQYGITFSSSIFNNPASPYYNTALFLLQNDKGVQIEDNLNWQPENNPFETLTKILDDQALLFNAEWILVDNVLYFERTDWIYNNLEVIYNVELDEVSTGYTHDASNLFGAWEGEYARDALDEMGNGMLNDGYFDIVEWNDPPSENQRGIKRVAVDYSAVRHSFDRGSLRDSTKFVPLMFNLDLFRTGRYPMQLDLIGFGRFGRSYGTTSDDMVIIGNHTTAKLKVLCLTSDLDRLDPKLVKNSLGFSTIANFGDAFEFFDYNFPMYFDAEYEKEELYQNFHLIGNPRKKINNRVITGEFEFELRCEDLEKLVKKAPIIGIKTHFGKGIAEKYIIDFVNCKVIAQNIQILCNFGN